MPLPTNLLAITDKIAVLVRQNHSNFLAGNLNMGSLHNDLDKLMDQLFQTAVAEMQLREVLFDIADHPENYLRIKFGRISLCEGLAECACFYKDGFNRFIYPRRKNIENKIVEHCQSIASANQVFRYVSLGCGEFLQDLLIMMKLLQRGIKHVNLILIDPKSIDTWQGLQQFLNQLAQESNNQYRIDVEYYHSMHAYRMAARPAPNIMTAIDLIDFYGDVLSDIQIAQFLLKNSAKMFVSVFHHDFEITENSLHISNLSSQTLDACTQLTTHRELIQRSELKVALIITTLTMDYFYVYILGLPREFPALTKLNLLMTKPLARTFDPQMRGVMCDAPTYLSLELLTQLAKMMLPAIELAIQFVERIEDHAAQLPNQDLVICNLDENNVMVQNHLAANSGFFKHVPMIQPSQCSNMSLNCLY